MAVMTAKRPGAQARVRVKDVLLAAVVFLLSMVAVSIIHEQHRISIRWQAVVLVGTSSFALVWRRRHPFGVLVVAVACAVVLQSLGFREGPLGTSSVILSVYTVAACTDRRTTWTTACASAAVLVGAALVTDPRAWLSPDNAAMLAWTALPAAVGDGVRSRRAYVAAVEERAEHAERTREQEARQRVAAERMRIARELHDVVAHHIALINAQAGVAVHLVEQRPEHVLTALEGIRDVSQSALDELRVTVSLLRQPDETAAPRDPTPGMSHVPDLLASFERAGLAVKQTVSGDPKPLPPAADLAAYRIIQEALTNVRKHSGVDQARLDLSYLPNLLTITVQDDGPSQPTRSDPGKGHGLIGMRERAGTVGGRVQAGPRAEGGFTVIAELPLLSGTVEGEAASAGTDETGSMGTAEEGRA
ncbi:sensor histidine kinase [Streptomyces sp. NBC_01361]|uniref:sensor histidine kinase n=1 Tax=Streptomyces sp. NBC_01361 TaxID=2903838 RepID=UPI002E33FC21|nr:sensor histidine kinase [Streptomyces sp. NBC_01361]